MFAYVYLAKANQGCPGEKPVPSFPFDFIDSPKPEYGQAEVIGCMVGGEG
jgi:hypothetical protein